MLLAIFKQLKEGKKKNIMLVLLCKIGANSPTINQEQEKKDLFIWSQSMF